MEVNSVPIKLNDDVDVVAGFKPIKRPPVVHALGAQMQKLFKPASTHENHRFRFGMRLQRSRHTGEDDDCMIDVVFHNGAYRWSMQVGQL